MLSAAWLRRPISTLINLTLAAGLFAVAAPTALAADTGAAASTRIVRCDEHIRSRKRGICANRLEPADFTALAPGVSWYYDWFYKPDGTPPPGLRFEFVPMVWGDRADDLAGLNRYLATAKPRPRVVLAINEPNLRGQAFITPQATAAAYARARAIASRYGLPVVGPQMALGSAAADSITAPDPIDGRTETYTFMIPFLKAVLYYADHGDNPTAVGPVSLHTYGSIGELHWAVDLMHKDFGRPVWVTEYAHTPNASEGLTYLMQATDYLERTPYVPGYAWFKERGNGLSSSLLSAPGQLTALGQAYVNMPVHEQDVYYRIPGRLQAEDYVSMAGAEIWPTSDIDGFADMASNAPDAWLDYNLFVDRPGMYAVRLRVTGEAGDISFFAGNQALGVAHLAQGSNVWQTVTTTIRLTAGAQTLRVRLPSSGQRLNWIEFANESGQ
jgi:hypothetical protein